MAHAAVSEGASAYEKRHYMIRAKLYAGLNRGTMTVGPLAEDERLKMILPQACCYCGTRQPLSADHLLPLKVGGPNVGDNLVWACRSCNSSKGARDVLDWLAAKQQFPPLLLLRRYLKLAIQISHERGIMKAPLSTTVALPFTLRAIPITYPPPGTLRLWILDLG
ncbi:MAG: HNH endonuclease [Acidobacteriota bacterium]|nr:HNH endonuclease [Acidobacteriota bacterium]